MIKKGIKIILLTLFIIGITIGQVRAQNEVIHLNVVGDTTSGKKLLENNQGNIEKSIVDYDPDKCEFTVEMTLNNTKPDKYKEKEDIEILFVIDNSPSMDFVTETGETRKEVIIPSAIKLTENIFNTMSNVKIGIVDFHGGSGSINCATVVQSLTDDKDTVIKEINNEHTKSTRGGTNIAAGLKLAQNNFSEEKNKKIVILLTDGMPNADLVSSIPDEVSTERAHRVQENTKEALLDLKNSGIYTITVLTGMSESDGRTDKKGTTYVPSYTNDEALAAAERIFGTQENPTGDAYYLVKTADINKILTEDIFNLISEKINQKMDEITIIDYLPDSLVENFDLSYVQKPTAGNISESIDVTDNSLKWNIATLRGGESVSVRYKFKLKNSKNLTSIIDTIIPVSTKIDLSYTDVDGNLKLLTVTDLPKIKLTSSKEEHNYLEEDDNEKLPSIIPNTGSSSTLFIIGFVILVMIVLVSRNKIKSRD